jgi:N-acetylglucosamine kinase-like BadF-type ATPase
MPGLLESPAELAAEVHRQVVTASVVVASDALTTHLGALAGRPGCVVAAGTGVIVLGTDHTSTWRQADGWGHLLGDDGSGAWIGAAGLRAALRHRDGRDGGSAVLLDKVVSRFGDTSTALGVIYGAPAAAHELAAFAPSVADAAHEGDPVAVEIWRRAGALLAESAHAAARALLASGPRFRAYGTAPTVPAAPEFSWGGRLFDAGPVLLTPFRAELTRRLPGAQLTAPAGDAVHGALLLARRGLPADRPHPARYAVEIPAGWFSG